MVFHGQDAFDDGAVTSRSGGDVFIFGGLGALGPVGDVLLGITSTGVVRGNVGIATSTPRGRLGIMVASSSPGILIQTTGNTGEGAMAIAVDANAVCKDAGPTGTCVLNDLAELFPTSEESLEAGDIAMFDSEKPLHLRKANNQSPITNNSRLAGIISTSPAIVFEGSGLKALGGVYKSPGGKVPLTLSGRVPVKVNLEGGDIKIGDPITISSVPGIGKKATEAGQIVGYALEDYSSPSEPPKIIVLANLSYWTPPTSDTSSTSESSWLAQAIDTVLAKVKEWFASIKELVLDKLTARKIATDELEIKDKATGEIYCVRIVNGEWEKTKGECSASSGTSDVPNIDGNSQDIGSPDIESPVIQLNGLNPTEIQVGERYSDPGATVTDNVNDNLGYKVLLNVIDSGNQSDFDAAVYPHELVLDTSAPAEYTITYIAADQAGNVGTATRTVVVFDPYATSTPSEPSSTSDSSPTSDTSSETSSTSGSSSEPTATNTASSTESSTTP